MVSRFSDLIPADCPEFLLVQAVVISNDAIITLPITDADLINDINL